MVNLGSGGRHRVPQSLAGELRIKGISTEGRKPNMKDLGEVFLHVVPRSRTLKTALRQCRWVVENTKNFFFNTFPVLYSGKLVEKQPWLHEKSQSRAVVLKIFPEEPKAGGIHQRQLWGWALQAAPISVQTWIRYQGGKLWLSLISAATAPSLNDSQINTGVKDIKGSIISLSMLWTLLSDALL